MIVSCENCGARYKLDPARITGRGVRITCPRCKNVFVVYRQQAEATGELPKAPPSPEPDVSDSPDDDEATQIFTRQASRPVESSVARPTPPPAAAPAEEPADDAAGSAAPAPSAASSDRGDVTALDFSAVGISGWKVKVRIGLVYDFSDYKTLARYIKDGRVDQDDQISHDGQTWTRLGDIDDLEAHFFDVYEAAEARQAAAGDAYGEDQPTRIVGAAALADKLDRTLDDEPDSDLAATMAAAAAAEDEIGATGANKATGPTFNDPFARQRERKASGQRRRRKSSGQQPKKEQDKPNRAPLIAGLVALLAVGGGGAWYVKSMSDQPSTQELAAESKREHESAKKAVQKQAKAYEQELEKTLRDTLEETAGEGEEDGWKVEGDPDEEELIPVGGPGSAQARTPRPPVETNGGMAVSNDPGGSTGSMSAAPASPQDHYNSGRALFREGRWNEAAAAFRQAVAGNPQSGEYRTWLGYSLMKAGQLDDARTELVAASNKGSARAHYYLGDLAAMQGDVGGAVGHWQAYLKEVPGDEARVQAKIDALMR